MCKLLFAEKCIPTTKKTHQENISIMFSVGKNYNKKKNPTANACWAAQWGS